MQWAAVCVIDDEPGLAASFFGLGCHVVKISLFYCGIFQCSYGHLCLRFLCSSGIFLYLFQRILLLLHLSLIFLFSWSFLGGPSVVPFSCFILGWHFLVLLVA